jgi:tRNA (guanosine-2'-O-)-methyltransferase
MRTNDRGGTRFAHELPSPVAAHDADELLTPERRYKYRQVLARRCERLAVVVEDCHDPHNATAIMRTCDAAGVMRVHVVAGRNSYKINPRISQGCHRYLDLRLHRHIDEAYAELRADGYRIAVSDLGQQETLGLDDLATQLAAQPLALVFGSEATGVSPQASAGADEHFLLPMQGFTESLNLSVCVAISLYGLRQESLLSDGPGDLSAERQTWWYDRWLREHKGSVADRFLAAFRKDPRSRVGSDRSGEELEILGGDESTDA